MKLKMLLQPLLLCLAGLAGLLTAMTLSAQTYPSQPIKLVVPFAAGTGSEIGLRLLIERLSLALKQPVVIENRPGGGSTLGTDVVAKAAPDGYTLLASYNSSIAPGPLMYSKIGYDPIKDFSHIALIGVYPQYIIVRPDFPTKTIQEFLALVRAKPGSINYASAGVGTSGFSCCGIAQADAEPEHGACALQRACPGDYRSSGWTAGYGADRQCG
jgi:tripartite-type tricarboxylate transporter receptor subunit TctC